MWIVVGVAAWTVVAGLVGVLIGRMIRHRDRQVPGGESRPDALDPRSTAPGADTPGLPPALGRGRSRPS